MYSTFEGSAGKILDLSDGIYSLQAKDSSVFTNSKGSKNLITFQGDLNYDGRVSMKDLAYLNAGANRQILDENGDVSDAASVSRDVDADFSGKIDLADLAVLDMDWGKTLHTGSETFTGQGDGEDELTWEQLTTQGDKGAWTNTAFEEQNTIEAALGGFNQTLNNPGASNIDGGNDTNSVNNDLLGTDFQDPLTFN